MLIHVHHHWPSIIDHHLWPYALRSANDVCYQPQDKQVSYRTL